MNSQERDRHEGYLSISDSMESLPVLSHLFKINVGIVIQE
jgi:hypothetical protein